MAPRSLWNGTVMLGLMAVPVKLHTATESKTVRFHEVHLKDGSRIQHRRFCTKEDAEVPYEEVVKGYELSSGEHVVLEKDELKAAAGDRAHVIEIEDCVCAHDIDPVFFDKTYYLGAGDEGGQAYRLLHDALEKTGRAGIGRFTFHDREYVVAIRPLDGVLALHTLRFADEIVDGATLDVSLPRKEPAGKELQLAKRLVETLHEPFKPERHRDEYRKAVMKAIDAKAKGKEIEAPDEEEPEAPDDLLAALEASL
ncbi:MAG TPA: Ku protein [Capillimicrobium sp.]|nr:Ku protein [Capillimicrobium sp.]